MHGVVITELIEKMNLRNMTPEIDAEKIVLSHPDVNRPALQLAGFYAHFDNERVQVIGYVEQEYIRQMTHERKLEMYHKLLSSQIPWQPQFQNAIHSDNLFGHRSWMFSYPQNYHSAMLN